MFIYGWITLISFLNSLCFSYFQSTWRQNIYSFWLPICVQENFRPSNVLFLEPGLVQRTQRTPADWSGRLLVYFRTHHCSLKGQSPTSLSSAVSLLCGTCYASGILLWVIITQKHYPCDSEHVSNPTSTTTHDLGSFSQSLCLSFLTVQWDGSSHCYSIS